jgi:phosphoribulokinase
VGHHTPAQQCAYICEEYGVTTVPNVNRHSKVTSKAICSIPLNTNTCPSLCEVYITVRWRQEKKEVIPFLKYLLDPNSATYRFHFEKNLFCIWKSLGVDICIVLGD